MKLFLHQEERERERGDSFNRFLIDQVDTFSCISKERRNRNREDGVSRKVNRVGSPVPTEGGPVRDEVLLVLEEREPGEGAGGEEERIVEAENPSWILVVGAGQAAKQTGCGRVGGEMLRVSSTLAGPLENQPPIGESVREGQHRGSDEHEEIRGVHVEREKREFDREGGAAEHRDAEAQPAGREMRAGGCRDAGRLSRVRETFDLRPKNAEAQQTYQEAQADNGVQPQKREARSRKLADSGTSNKP